MSQLQTIVTEIEAILNSRPLVYVGSEVTDQVLTPAHFCHGILDVACLGGYLQITT
jgi:hypothetical protein